MIFGGWFFVTVSLLLCCSGLKEPGQETMLPSPPMVPGALKTFLNKPFKLLLPSWILESIAVAIFGGLLTYFVRYVVQPEFMDGTNGTPNCIGPDGLNASWKCKSTNGLRH